LEGGLVYVATQGGAFYALDANTGQERWQVDIDGEIGSSLVISRGVLYAGASFFGTGDRQGGIIALDAQDGHELWRYTTAGETATSPVLAGSRLIFGSDNDKVYAVDTRVAEEIWTYDAGAPLDVAPVTADGVVYTGDATGNLHALDAANGKLLWKLDAGKRERVLPLIYTTLTSAYAGGNKVYFANVLDGPVYAVDAATGNERWRFATTGLMTPVPTSQASERDASIVTSPPAVSGNTLYVGVSFGPLGIPVPDRIGYLYALDASTGTERWKVQTETQVVGRPIVQGDTVYYAANAGIIHAADTSTGRDRWRFEADGPVNASLLLSEGTLYFGTFGGVFYALR
jgi:outer membrane protein assembly factor BamB